MKLGMKFFGKKTGSGDERTASGTDEAGSGRAGRGKGRDRNGIYLYVSDSSWQARFVGAEGEPVEKPVGEESVRAVDGQSPTIEDVIRQAVDKIGKGTFSNIGYVVLILDDPGIVLVENGDALSGFSSTNVSAVRNFGQEHLGVEEISFGFAQTQPGASRGAASAPSKGGLYGFIDIEKLRDYLSAFGDIAQKVAAVTPAPYVAITAGQVSVQAAEAETRCDLFISANASTVSISNASHAVAVVRSIPIGTQTIAATLAEAQGLRLDMALDEMKRRDCMKSILTSDADTDGSSVPSQFERVLGPIVRRLAEEIEISLSFFAEQRAVFVEGGKSLSVHGAENQIRGLGDWLSRRLNMPVKNAVVDCVDEALAIPRVELLNLLSGSQGPLFAIGKVNWVWDKNRVRSQKEVAADPSRDEQAPAAGSRETERRSARAGDRARRTSVRTGFRRGGGRGRAQQGGKTFFGIQLSSGSGGGGVEKNERAGFGLLTLFAILVLYGGYTSYIQPAVKKQQRAAAALERALAQNEVMRREVQTAESLSHRRVSTGVTDKVLWTEKFLALSCYASREIWLTDVYITNESVKIGQNSENLRKLIIKGAVLPSYDGHLLKISNYIRRLEKDSRGLFMADFKTITFEGAAVDLEDVAEIVRFTIEAWYDNNRDKDKEKKTGRVANQDLSIDGCNADQQTRADSKARKG